MPSEEDMKRMAEIQEMMMSPEDKKKRDDLISSLHEVKRNMFDKFQEVIKEERKNSMEGLIEGRMVHYVLPEFYKSNFGKDRHVPAVVTKVWENGKINLQAFLDGSNDDPNGMTHPTWKAWHTSVEYEESGKPGTWHWIEKV